MGRFPNGSLPIVFRAQLALAVRSLFRFGLRLLLALRAPGGRPC
jgi:hypothetical protein